MLGSLALPPKLALRALDDLHHLASAARSLAEMEARLNERADAILALGERFLALGERIEALGERMDERGEVLVESAAHLDARGDEILAAIRELSETATDVADRGREVAASLPTLTEMGESARTLAHAAEPLQGTIERFGRIADRSARARGRAGRGDG